MPPTKPPSSFWERSWGPSCACRYGCPRCRQTNRRPRETRKHPPKAGAGKTGHGIAQQHDGRQHKTGVDGTHECHSHIGYAGTRRTDIPNAHRKHQCKKQRIQQQRVAQRRERKEHGGSDTQALVGHLAIELRHAEILKAAQAAHDGDEDGGGNDTQNQAENKYDGVDDTCGGTGNKAGKPRSRGRAALGGRRLGSRRLGRSDTIKPPRSCSVHQTYGRGLIGQNGVDKTPTIKVGPIGIGDIKLGIGNLPQQIVRKAKLAGGSNHKLRIG